MTYDSAFQLAELSNVLRQSPAAGIYLVVDLAGDLSRPLLTSLEASLRTPRVVLSAVSSGPNLSLADAAIASLVAHAGQLRTSQFKTDLSQAGFNVQVQSAAAQPDALMLNLRRYTLDPVQ